MSYGFLKGYPSLDLVGVTAIFCKDGTTFTEEEKPSNSTEEKKLTTLTENKKLP